MSRSYYIQVALNGDGDHTVSELGADTVTIEPAGDLVFAMNADTRLQAPREVARFKEWVYYYEEGE